MAGILPVLDAVVDGGDLSALERLLRALPGIESAPRGEARRRFDGQAPDRWRQR